MKQFVIWIILLFGLLSCSNQSNKNTPSSSLLNQEYNCIIKINALNDFLNQSESNPVMNSSTEEILTDASRILKKLNPTSSIYLARKDKDENDTAFLILTKNNNDVFVLDSTYSIEKLPKSDIRQIDIDSTTYYQKNIDGHFVASNSIQLIEELNSDNKNTQLAQLLESADDDVIASISFEKNQKQLSKLLLNRFDEPNGSNLIIDVQSSTDKLIYNGIIKNKDSNASFISCFKNTTPQLLNAIDIVPANAKSVIGITYNDYNVFRKNQEDIYKNSTNEKLENILTYTDEFSKADDLLILHSLDTELIVENIGEKLFHEKFREVDIFSLTEFSVFKNEFNPFFNLEDISYFAEIKDFLVFSNSIDSLQNLISSSLNGNTLSNSNAYQNLTDFISDEMSVFIYKNEAGLEEVFDENLKGYKANVVQFTYEKDYAHINGIFKRQKKAVSSNTVSEIFSTELDNALLISPQTVKNHINKSYDIITQDVKNVLYLISNSGKILWRKQLDGKILGEIEQIDMYKNGRLQLAFATSNRLYVVDRNGNDVNPFPLKFRDDITQPLSVFDYDNNRNFRLLVTQGENLLMYDAKGKMVKGFNYKSNKKSLSSQPKHFRVSSKDYIVFKTDNKLQVINRRGQTRINVRDKINYSNNEIYLHKSKFSSTSALGELVQVDTKGRISRKNLNLPKEHSIDATSKTLVALTENKLTIKSRTIDLDYGDYSAPRIFYLNDKIYVSTTDRQSKKVYLFDSQAKSIPNFPVYGTSSGELQNIDDDRALELVTQDGSKNILVYKLY